MSESSAIQILRAFTQQGGFFAVKAFIRNSDYPDCPDVVLTDDNCGRRHLELMGTLFEQANRGLRTEKGTSNAVEIAQ
jgi:hypothetical protein